MSFASCFCFDWICESTEIEVRRKRWKMHEISISLVKDSMIQSAMFFLSLCFCRMNHRMKRKKSFELMSHFELPFAFIHLQLHLSVMRLKKIISEYEFCFVLFCSHQNFIVICFRHISLISFLELFFQFQIFWIK